MMQLSEPKDDFTKVLDACWEGITGNNSLKNRLSDSRAALENEATNYVALGAVGELYSIHATVHAKDVDPIVVADLRKSELVNLYETYFRGIEKPGRIIYDALLASANEKCPFCGGIGRPRNLDHYLPKAYFPQFSVLPKNLIPSCRDCNMDGKGPGFATTAGDQIIQPYLDSAHFFEEQWVFANYKPGNNEPGVIEYFVNPPEHWDEFDKCRVKKHFNDFDISIRFSKEAGARLITLMPQIDSLLSIGLTIEEIKTTLLQTSIDSSPFVNHWERVMCLALMNAL
ncbi:HNH endonuclease [Methylomonas sp. MgM2]